MIKPIVKDIFRLSQKAAPATRADLPAAQDLLDTLRANRSHCVGMAANMIGVNKRIIAVDLAGLPLVMLNPVLERRSGIPYETEEGCLCHSGTRPTTRYPSVTVSYEDMRFTHQRQVFTGFVAQIIQHELDHLEGILI